MDNQEMEFAAGFKPPPSIPEIVSKFSKVCKLRSIGVFDTSKNPSPSVPEKNSSDTTAEDDSMKIHPQPTVKQAKLDECGKIEMFKLFETLLALKLSYVKFQEAHIPYDPEKIRAADKEVVSRLQSLCKIKKIYKEKILKEVKSSSVCSNLLVAEIKLQERALEKLKSQAVDKENEVIDLREKLKDLKMRNTKLEKNIKEQENESLKSLSHYSFDDVVKIVGKAIHDFAKPLIALMKVSDWDLDQAANVIQNSVVYAKRLHKKYVFEAFVARRMFCGILEQECILENIMKLDDPIDALVENPQSGFARFCREKYLLVVHPEMEASFFGNMDHRSLLANGIHPNTPFYRAFVKMARWVWFLRGFAASMEPKAEIFGVKEGSEFSDDFMEVPEEIKEYKNLLDESREICKVEFMIMPGFRRGETLIRSQVYVSKLGFSNDSQ